MLHFQSFESEPEPMFPTAPIYRDFWNFPEPSNLFRVESFVDQNRQRNTFCCQGYQKYCIPKVTRRPALRISDAWLFSRTCKWRYRPRRWAMGTLETRSIQRHSKSIGKFLQSCSACSLVCTGARTTI